MTEEQKIGWWRQGFQQNKQYGKTKVCEMGTSFGFCFRRIKAIHVKTHPPRPHTHTPLTLDFCSTQCILGVSNVFCQVVPIGLEGGNQKEASFGLCPPPFKSSRGGGPTNPHGRRKKLRQDPGFFCSLFILSAKTACQWRNGGASASIVLSCADLGLAYVIARILQKCQRGF